jgi:hypothetical protein
VWEQANPSPSFAKYAQMVVGMDWTCTWNHPIGKTRLSKEQELKNFFTLIF